MFRWFCVMYLGPELLGGRGKMAIVGESPNKQLQRTVRDKVPRHVGQRAAAELRRYTQ